ncbi:hypothetical protein WJX79_010315 [Trebouxia sp. C0005]
MHKAHNGTLPAYCHRRAPEDVDAPGVTSESDSDFCRPSACKGPHGWDGFGQGQHPGAKRRCRGDRERPHHED